LQNKRQADIHFNTDAFLAGVFVLVDLSGAELKACLAALAVVIPEHEPVTGFSSWA
jgi:hypothetical protein